MLVLVGGGFAEAVQARLVTLVVAVREVEPSDGKACVDELLEHGDLPARRAQRAHDLGLPRRRVGLAQDRFEVDVAPAEARAGGAELGLRQTHG